MDMTVKVLKTVLGWMNEIARAQGELVMEDLMDPDPLGDAIQMAADYPQIKKDVEKKIAAGYCEQQAWSDTLWRYGHINDRAMDAAEKQLKQEGKWKA